MRVESYPKHFLLRSTRDIFAENQEDFVIRPTVFTVIQNRINNFRNTSTVELEKIKDDLFSNGMPHFLSIIDDHLLEVAASVEAKVVPHEWVLLEGTTPEDEIEDQTSTYFPELEGFVLGAIVNNTKQYGYDTQDYHRQPSEHAGHNTWYELNQTLENTVDSITERQGWSINDLSRISQFSGDLPISQVTSHDIWRNSNITLIDIEPRITLL